MALVSTLPVTKMSTRNIS